jgi:hypothetical protein
MRGPWCDVVVVVINPSTRGFFTSPAERLDLDHAVIDIRPDG